MNPMGVGFGFSRPIECGAIASLSTCIYGAFAPLLPDLYGRVSVAI